MRRALIALALVVLLSGAAGALPAPPRPLSGCAMLAVPAPLGLAPQLVVYAEPGVQRVAELPLDRVPLLYASQGELALSVLARKGRWLKIAFDDAERQGWIEESRRWSVLPWQETLAGRRVRLLPGMKKVAYAVRSAPDDAGKECATLSRDQRVGVVSLSGDWARIEAPAGWLRWRDGEGRLTVAPEAFPSPEKR